MIARLLACFALLATPLTAQAEPVSGSAWLLPETRALQDDFANPGLLWVDLGGSLWQAGSPSCASCHGAPEALRGVGARYPQWSAREGRVVSLEQQINGCRSRHQGLEALAYSSRDLLALTTLVMHQSRGLPQSVATGGPAAAVLAEGAAYFAQRRGQLNLSCAQCHQDNAGQRLRGEVISQGQINGFPVYRQLWQDLGSVGRMIAWCNDAVRATPLAEGSAEAVALELYLRSRGAGLGIETPGIRR